MFTGMIEEVGMLRRVERKGQAMVLSIAASRILEDIHPGDSISVNGVCLTVIAFDEGSFTVDVMPETFRRSTLKELPIGARVNLERAMPAQGRFGGHIVQGHVDSTGVVESRQQEDNAVVFRIVPADPAVLRYILPKGSIAVDGISLTVVDVSDTSFSVSIIPHTLEQTVLAERRPGQRVNLETDIIGKYMERLLCFRLNPDAGGTSPGKGALTAEFLAEHGFM
jgi:riboflavin synthase